MWRLLDNVGHKVPHLLLLSATPMQLHPAEYHSMLDLLGIPEWWAGSGRLDKVLALLASSMTVPSLQGVRDALSGISSTIKEMNPDLNHLGVSAAEIETLGRLADTGEIGLGRVVEAQRHWTETYSLLVKTHPGHLLTIRNTRGALSDLGYSFPARRFEAPPLTIDPAVADFYSMVDVYLESAFGKLEAAAHPEKANALGFMKSTYRQRLASSLRAAEVSLGRRLAYVESVLRGAEVEDASESEELGAEWEDDFDPPIARGAHVSQMLEHACRTELSFLHDLVRQLEQLDVEDSRDRPKARHAHDHRRSPSRGRRMSSWCSQGTPTPLMHASNSSWTVIFMAGPSTCEVHGRRVVDRQG